MSPTSFSLIMYLIIFSIIPLAVVLIYFLRRFLLFICKYLFGSSRAVDSDERNHLPEEYVRREFQSTIPSAWDSMEHHRRDAQVDTSFGTRAAIARKGIRVLPPFKTFNGEQASDCPICLEEFHEGELIQPFALCAHEFHSSCLSSWLLGGKTTCPVCRQDLSTIVSTCIDT